MQKILFSILFLFAISLFSQDLPTNPEPGKCYVRCKTPDIWENKDVTIEVNPAYKKLTLVPATYRTVSESVVIQDAYKQLTIMPAKYETKSFSIETQGPSQTLKIVPGKTSIGSVTVETVSPSKSLEVVPASFKNETLSVVQDDAKTLEIVPAKYENQTFEIVVHEAYQKLEVVPARFETRDEVIVVSEASKKLEVVPAKYEKRTETVVVHEAYKKLEVVPAKYETQTETIVTQPAYKKLELVPAKYETRDEVITINEGGETMTIIPAKWGTETYDYIKSELGSKINIVPAKFGSDSKSIEIKSESAQWEMSAKKPDCESSDPNDCRYWCYKSVPAEFITVNVTKLLSDASVSKIDGCLGDNTSKPGCTKGTYTKNKLISPASTSIVKTPSVTKVIKKTVMVAPPTTRVIEVPAVTKVVQKTVMVAPPTTREIEVPAVTKTIEKTVMVTPPTTREIEIPAVTKVVQKTVMVAPPTTRVIEVPAVKKSFTKSVMVAPPSTKTISSKTPAVAYTKTIVNTPATTREREVPGKSETFKVTNISDDTVETVQIPGKTETFTKQVMTSAPVAVESEISAKTTNITRTVVDKDAYVTEETVPAQYKTIKTEKLVSKGGLTSWKAVACEIVENYSILPIQWNLNSAELTPQAKSIIDTKLLPVLKEGVAAEIASHTDSRGTKESNEDLSERRALAVANYLISKGIHPSKLVSKGYGESRLKNRCEDGVPCTEAEHQINRRTEFRIINQ